ncbi:MAG: LamG domain-containing protein [Methanoregula sp.]|nr:LamG domain-containing protein [Methanoregula sp.]
MYFHTGGASNVTNQLCAAANTKFRIASYTTYTLSALFYYTTTPGYQCIFSYTGGVDSWNGTTGIQYNLYLNNSGIPVFIWYYGTTGYNHSITSSVTPTLNAWHHLAVIITATNVIMYLDGVQVAAYGSAGGFTATTAPSALVIGNYLPSSGGRVIRGYLDEVAMFAGQALNITDLYKTTVPYALPQTARMIA